MPTSTWHCRIGGPSLLRPLLIGDVGTGRPWQPRRLRVDRAGLPPDLPFLRRDQLVETLHLRREVHRPERIDATADHVLSVERPEAQEEQAVLLVDQRPQLVVALRTGRQLLGREA